MKSALFPAGASCETRHARAWRCRTVALGLGIALVVTGVAVAARGADAAVFSGPEPGAHTLAEHSVAVFMLGLILGVVMGIAAFFFYLRRRERKEHRRFEEEEAAEAWSQSFSDPLLDSRIEPPNLEDGAEQMAPWERPADWWRDPEDRRDDS